MKETKKKTTELAAPVALKDQLVTGEKTRDGWLAFWKTICSRHRTEKGYVDQITRWYYLTCLYRLTDMKLPEERVQFAKQFGPILDSVSIFVIPYIAQQMNTTDCCTDIVQTYREAAGFRGEDQRPSYTIDQHFEEITTIENDPAKRLWAADTEYPFVEKFLMEVATDFRSGYIDDSFASMLYYLVGIFETGATGDQMSNEDRVQEYHYRVKDGVSSFVFLVFLLEHEKGSLRVRMTKQEQEDLIVNGLKYLEENLPSGVTVAQLEVKYPFLFTWLRMKLQIIRQDNFLPATQRPRLQNRT